MNLAIWHLELGDIRAGTELIERLYYEDLDDPIILKNCYVALKKLGRMEMAEKVGNKLADMEIDLEFVTAYVLYDFRG